MIENSKLPIIIAALFRIPGRPFFFGQGNPMFPRYMLQSENAIQVVARWMLLFPPLFVLFCLSALFYL